MGTTGWRVASAAMTGSTKEERHHPARDIGASSLEPLYSVEDVAIHVLRVEQPGDNKKKNVRPPRTSVELSTIRPSPNFRRRFTFPQPKVESSTKGWRKSCEL
jgi:hypothetical protein